MNKRQQELSVCLLFLCLPVRGWGKVVGSKIDLDNDHSLILHELTDKILAYFFRFCFFERENVFQNMIKNKSA